MAFSVYGASDDVVVIEGELSDEIDAYQKVVRISIGDDSGGVRIRLTFSPPWSPGLWTAELAAFHETLPFPWPVRVETDGRTVVVRVDCPEGTTISWRSDDR